MKEYKVGSLFAGVGGICLGDATWGGSLGADGLNG